MLEEVEGENPLNDDDDDDDEEYILPNGNASVVFSAYRAMFTTVE